MERDQGVCLRVWDWSETSQTLVVFARSLGLLRAVAKGARRPNGNFSGGLEALTRGELLVSVRPLQKNPNALATLTAWDLQEAFPHARRSLDAFYIGLTMLDLVQHGVHDQDPHPEVFDALVLGLRTMDTPSTARRSLLAFAWALLSSTGHAPELELDLLTHAPLARANTFAFFPRRGGFASDGSVPSEARGEPAWRVRGITRDALLALAQGDEPAQDEDAIARACRLLLMYFREVHQSEPRAVELLLDAKVLG